MKTYKFLSEATDKRSKLYRDLEKQLDNLLNKYGKESKQIKEFFNKEIDFEEFLNKKVDFKIT